MRKIQITIINRLGLHARASAKFVTMASGFKSDITLIRNAHQVNGKSIMGVMTLAAVKGTQLDLIANGHDEELAVEKLVALVKNRFDEAE